MKQISGDTLVEQFVITFIKTGLFDGSYIAGVNRSKIVLK